METLFAFIKPLTSYYFTQEPTVHLIPKSCVTTTCRKHLLIPYFATSISISNSYNVKDYETDDDTTANLRSTIRSKKRRNKRKPKQEEKDEQEQERRRLAKDAKKKRKEKQKSEGAERVFSPMEVIDIVIPEHEFSGRDSVMDVAERQRMLNNMSIAEVEGGEIGEAEFVYVENMATGKFKRVRIKALREAHMVQVTERRSNIHDPEIMRRATTTASTFIAAISLFCQGVLSGLALLHVILTMQAQGAGGRKSFLVMYQPIAANADRLFFIFTTIAFMGSADLFMNEVVRRVLLPFPHPFFFFFFSILFILAFLLLSLLCVSNVFSSSISLLLRHSDR